MVKWFHKCDKEWMKARQQCLTATDVKDLLPVTKTGRKRTVGDESYLKVFARKVANITQDDLLSTGAAARGHVLEPFAVSVYNDTGFGKAKLYHWDDIVVTRPNHRFGMLGFSPDAMSMSMPETGSERLVAIGDGIEEIGEVKCYSAENHMIRGYTPKEMIEERWQVATAMAVCESIDEAHIMFFNPSLRNEMFVADYTRADLEDEIATILETEEAWLDWLGNLANLEHHKLWTEDGSLEEKIIQSIMDSESLNPEGERSVTL